MNSSKDSKEFCVTSYKKWLALLVVMTIALLIWLVIGYDEDKTMANLNKMGLENAFVGDTLPFDGNAQLSKLQESYSDIAAKVRAVTVNISASRSTVNAFNNSRTLKFANPFGGTPQQSPPLHGSIRGNPGAINVKIMAPPIAFDAVSPHEFRGECLECHLINKILPANNNAAARNTGRVSIGTGIIIDSSGYILTNYHVISDATDTIVTIDNGNKYRAAIKYTDFVSDLAILKINSATKLPAATLGNSDLIQEGDIILSVGNPFGLSQTITSGIISSASRTVSIGGKQYTNLIQIDAAINRGSSGGPLINIRGEVIGINTAIYSMTGEFTGIGFAIPINRAKETFAAVPAMRGLAANMIDLKVGEVITIAMQPNNTGAWFGAEVGPIDNIIAEQFGLTNTKGVIVNQVFADSPAERAGVKRGDVILKINGRKTADIGRFQKLTSLLNPGDVMRMSLMRDNQEVRLTVGLESKQGRTITKQPANTRVAVAPPREMEWAGMEVTPITPQLALRYGIRKGGSGVVIIEVEGMAAAAGIMNGDVIRGLNTQDIKNMTDFVNTAPNINILDGVLFDISRRGDPLYITM